MTEQQLRQKVADKMTSWVGATKGSAKHAEILKIYNDHRPLARGYKMKVNDAYCAATVSAAWIACGLAPYTGTECGVEKFARLAQDKGIWVENDAHVPKLGDAVVYDWQDNGVGDCTGAGDHIGIVTKAGATSFTVTEGNMTGGKVGTRTMSVNGRYIRRFITPDYADIARALGGASIPTDTAPDTSGKSIEEIAKEVIAGKWGTGTDRRNRLQAAGYAYTTVQAKVNEILGGGAGATEAKPTTTPSASAAKAVAAEKFDRSLTGTYIVTPNIGANVRSGPSTAHGIIKAVSKGTKVSNYGYYSIRGGVKWYYVRIGSTVGFISSTCLKKV